MGGAGLTSDSPRAMALAGLRGGKDRSSIFLAVLRDDRPPVCSQWLCLPEADRQLQGAESGRPATPKSDIYPHTVSSPTRFAFAPPLSWSVRSPASAGMGYMGK